MSSICGIPLVVYTFLSMTYTYRTQCLYTVVTHFEVICIFSEINNCNFRGFEYNKGQKVCV